MITIEQLTIGAIPYFENNDNESILATDDGQYFWPTHAHFAKSHVGNMSERIFTIKREDAISAAEKQNTSENLQKEIDAEKAQKDLEVYNKSVKKAEEAFGKEKYEDARKACDLILTLKPNDATAQNMITKINELLLKAESKLKEDAEKEIKDTAEKEYNDTIQKADELFAKNDFENAMKNYDKASLINPDQQYPKDKIIECSTEMSKPKKGKK